jgi:deazaflavin-dependent oxidoreductase (nitroreductase family)
MRYKGMRSFNKHVLNRVTRYLARAPFGPFALVRHVGRRTCKVYETPIMVERVSDGFLVALTYGPEVDWYLNVVAAGHCTLVWHGRTASLGPPQPVSPDDALKVFPGFERMVLQRRGTRDFVRMAMRPDGVADEQTATAPNGLGE